MAALREDVLRRNTRTHKPKTASGKKTPNFRCAGPGLERYTSQAIADVDAKVLENDKT